MISTGKASQRGWNNKGKTKVEGSDHPGSQFICDSLGKLKWEVCKDARKL